jgi:hypothetical protein
MEAFTQVFSAPAATPATQSPPPTTTMPTAPTEKGDAAPMHELHGLSNDNHAEKHKHGLHLPHLGGHHSHGDGHRHISMEDVGKAGHVVSHAMTEALHLIKQEMATIRHDHGLFHHKRASRDGVGSAGTHHDVDPALLFGMERTYFSATNQSFYMMMIATGLMAIDNTDLVAMGLGFFLYACAIIHFASNYLMHFRRVRTLEAGHPISLTGSLLWTGGLAALGMSVAVIELVYIFVYPVLDRAKAVELTAPANPNE